jgi:hypothetical protein
MDDEDPLDPAAVEGERKSRELDPWGVMAFEFSVVLKGVEKTIAAGMERLRQQAEAEPVEKLEEK